MAEIPLTNFISSQNSKEKRVELLIIPTNVNYIAFNLNNSCTVAPTIRNGKLVTTKKKSTIHGYGFKSIKRIADKYDGDVSFDYDKEKQLFSIRIVLSST